MGEAVTMSQREKPGRVEALVRDELHLSPTSAVLLSDAAPSSQKNFNNKLKTENIDWNNIPSTSDIYHSQNRGTGLEKQPESQHEARLRAAAAAQTVKAVSSGDISDLQKAVGQAYKNTHGDNVKLTAYAEQLSKELKPQKIDVKYHDGSMQFHKQGDEHAVTMQARSSLSHSTGNIVTTVDSFASRPQDGEKVRDDPAAIVKLFSKEANEVKSVKEIATAWKEASETHDYSRAHTQILAAVKDAYARGGSSGVSQLKIGLQEELGLESYTDKNAPHIFGWGKDEEYRIMTGRRVNDKEMERMLYDPAFKDDKFVKGDYDEYIHVTSPGFSIPRQPEYINYSHYDENGDIRPE